MNFSNHQSILSGLLFGSHYLVSCTLMHIPVVLSVSCLKQVTNGKDVSMCVDFLFSSTSEVDLFLNALRTSVLGLYDLLLYWDPLSDLPHVFTLLCTTQHCDPTNHVRVLDSDQRSKPRITEAWLHMTHGIQSQAKRWVCQFMHVGFLYKHVSLLCITMLTAFLD